MAEDLHEYFDYAGVQNALKEMVGRRVTVTVVSNAVRGVQVATIGVGYLFDAGQFGEYPRDDEVTTYSLCETQEWSRGYHHPLWPSIYIHDVADFEGRSAGAYVNLSFAGITLSVALAITAEAMAAKKAHEERVREGRSDPLN